MNRSTPEAVDTPVSTKDRVEMASRFPGPQATKDPKVVTAMKSHPGVKRSTGQTLSKVISSSSEISTVKIPIDSSKKD